MIPSANPITDRLELALRHVFLTAHPGVESPGALARSLVIASARPLDERAARGGKPAPWWRVFAARQLDDARPHQVVEDMLRAHVLRDPSLPPRRPVVVLDDDARDKAARAEMARIRDMQGIHDLAPLERSTLEAGARALVREKFGQPERERDRYSFVARREALDEARLALYRARRSR